MNSIKIFLNSFLIIFLIGKVITDTGCDLYVSKTGNDGNPGTFESPCLTIEHTITLLNSTHTRICISPGTYVLTSPLYLENGDWVLKSLGDRTSTFIDGAQSMECLHIELSDGFHPKVEGLTFQNCRNTSASNNGGAINAWCSASYYQVEINSCGFYNNSGQRGGAIYSENCQMKLSNNIIQNNFAEDSGGGFCCFLSTSVLSVPTLYFTDNIFSNNSVSNPSKNSNIENKENSLNTFSPLSSCKRDATHNVNDCDDCFNGGSCGLDGSCRCLPGSYRPELNTTLCPFCSPGKFTSNINENYCRDCDLNTFSAYYGSTICDSCPAGTVTIGTGQIECTPVEVQNLQATNILSSEFTLEWDPPSQFSVTNYNIYYSYNDSVEWDQITISNETSYTFSNIFSGNYSVKIQGINNQGEGLNSTIIDIETLPPGQPSAPIVVINETEFSPTSFGVSWSIPNHGGSPIDHYNITFYPQGQPESIVNNSVPYTQLWFTATDLLSGEYVVNVRAVSTVEGIWSDPKLVWTHMAVVPSVMDPVNIDIQYPDGFRVSWIPPDSNGGQEIVKYEIEMTPEEGSVKTYTANPSPLYKTITGLLTGNFSFRIRADNGITPKADYSEFVNATTADPTAPYKPGSLRLYSAYSYYIYMRWNAPRTGGSPITDYYFQHRKQGDTTWITNHIQYATTYYYVYPLLNGTYEFQVAACNIIGCGPYSNIATESTAEPTIPSYIYSVTKTDGNSTSITISWSAPSNGGLEIDNYYVMYTVSGGTEFIEILTNSTETTWTVNDLESGSYDFKVYAHNAIGWSSYAYISTFSTDPTQSPSPVGTITQINESSTTITLEWSKPSTGGREILKYHIDFHSFQSQEWQEAVYDLEGEAPDTLNFTITSLLSDNYTVRIAAENVNGVGNFSSEQNFTTDPPTTPGLPRNITLLDFSQTSIHLSWEYPENNGGEEITNFIVYYFGQTENMTGFMEIENISECMIEGLYTDNYSVLIAAQNPQGVGDNETFFAVMDIEPGIPENVQNIEHVAATATTITLQWDAVNNNGRKILYYLVDYLPQDPKYGGEKEDNITTADNPILHTIQNLYSGNYWVTIYAYNSIGNSESNQVLVWTTEPVAPGIVSNLQGAPLSPVSISLTWDVPNHGGRFLEYYLVKYNCSVLGINGIVINTSSTEPVWNVTGLLSSNYTFVIKAANSEGICESWSNPKTVSTNPPEAPSTVGDAQVTRQLRTLLDVEWTPPDYNGGWPIAYYNISWEGFNVSGSGSSAVNSFQIDGLILNSFYNVTITASNGFNSSAPKVFELQTAPAYPAQVTGVFASEYAPDYFVVQWNLLDDPDLTSYFISLGSQNQSLNISGINPSSNMRLITNLIPATNYSVRVCGYIDQMQGIWSQTAVIRTNNSVPGAVFGIYTTESTQTTLSIAWEEAIGNGLEIDYYSVTILSSQGNPINTLSVIGLSTTVGGLTADTLYQVNVIAHNDLGLGASSSSAWLRTASEESSQSNKGLAAGLGSTLGAFAIISVFAVLWYKKKTKKIKLPPPPNFDPFKFGKIYEASFSSEQHSKIKSLDPLIDLLFDGEFTLVRALFRIIRSADSESLCKSLTFLFEKHNSEAIDLINLSIRDEVSRIITSSTLFRSNSYASKILSTYAKLHGLPYLYRTIAIEVFEICNELVDSVEVDERQLKNLDLEDSDCKSSTDDQITQDVDVNKWRLLLTTQKILQRIFKSISKMPPQFRTISHELSSQVRAKFEGQERIAVASFIFLRFICPSITAPEAYGLVRELPSDSARRHLILVTKTLQNVANGTNFRGDGVMQDLSVFVTTNQPRANQFFDAISQPIQDYQDPIPVSFPPQVIQSSKAIIHRYMCQNKERLLKDLEENAPKLKVQLEKQLNELGEPIPLQYTKI
eukprot:Anaeramoba_ignava/a218007_26.p1 GENE.a218007_26~~a218007_26.p1  ORF type:complete len:1896 (-),score=419.75 a218007_26:31-5718(-)